MTPSRYTEELAMAESYAAELRATVDQLRKFHSREAEYTDLANGLQDLISDFIGSKRFADMRRELQDHDEAVGAAEEAAESRSYLAKVT